MDRDIVKLLVILALVLAVTAIFMPKVFYTGANFKSMCFKN